MFGGNQYFPVTFILSKRSTRFLYSVDVQNLCRPPSRLGFNPSDYVVVPLRNAILLPGSNRLRRRRRSLP